MRSRDGRCWSRAAAGGWARPSGARLARAGARVVLVARSGGGAGGGGGGDPRRGRRGPRAARPTSGRQGRHPSHRGRGGRAGRAPSTCWCTTRARSGPRPCGPCSTPTCEDLERVLDVNLVGPFRLTPGDAGRDGAARPGPRPARHLGRGRRGLPELGRLRRVQGGARPPGAHLGGGAGRHRRARPDRRPGRDAHAHARRGDARRRPGALADPAAVAESLLELIRDAESLRSGSRVEAAASRRPRSVEGRRGPRAVRAAPPARRRPPRRRDADRRRSSGRRPAAAAARRRPAGRQRRGHPARVPARAAPRGRVRSSCGCSGCRRGRRWPARRCSARATGATQTEDRPPPPALAVGRRARVRATASTRGRRACLARVAAAAWTSASTAPARACWRALYAQGRPVQYSYLPAAAARCARSRRRSRRGPGRPRCRPPGGR